MEKSNINILSEGIYSAASNLNNYILGSCTLLLTVLLIKFFSKDQKTFKVFEVDIPIRKLWILICAYTIGHLYFSLILVQRIDRLAIENIVDEKEEIWLQITYGGKVGSLFSNMEKRSVNNGFSPNFKVYKMENNDITTWVSILISMLLFLTVIDYKTKLLRHKLYSVYLGLFFCITNWIIGSWWAIKISILAP